jgi:hypothetical protein
VERYCWALWLHGALLRGPEHPPLHVADKPSFWHFMLKEIHEQPECGGG